MMAENKKRDEKPIVVMVAGLSRKGKSTAMNNLFKLDFKAKLSAKSVTKKFTPKVVSKSDLKLVVIDTPGLGALDLPSSKVKEDIKKYTTGLDFTLIYCLSVSASDSMTDADQNVVSALVECCNKEIWNKCLLFLTFADTVKEEPNYVEHLRNHSAQFEKLLTKNGISSKVKLIFDYLPADKTEIKLEDIKPNPTDIIAVPVAKYASTTNTLPGISLEGYGDWTDAVYEVLLMKVDPVDTPKYLDYRYSVFTTAAAAAAVVTMRVRPVISVLGTGGLIVAGGLVVAGGIGIKVSQYLKWKETNPSTQLTKIIELAKEEKEAKEEPPVES